MKRERDQSSSSEYVVFRSTTSSSPTTSYVGSAHPLARATVMRNASFPIAPVIAQQLPSTPVVPNEDELSHAFADHDRDARLDVDVEGHLHWLETGEGSAWPRASRS